MATRTAHLQSQQVDQAAEIASAGPTGNDLSFVHVAWTQVVLPRSRWGDSEYHASCGDAWLQVRAGTINIGGVATRASVPSGAMARLALAQISTYVARHRTLEIPIGRSAAAWVRSIAASESAAHLRRARETLIDLAAADITIGWRNSTVYARPVHAVSEWRFGLGGVAWPSTIQVSRDYAEAILESAVPIDQRTLMALRGSALAMDIYTWLAYRLYRVPDHGVLVPWRALEQQFAVGGSEAVHSYRGAWRRKFRRALRHALTQYGAGKVTESAKGLRLLPSPPPVPAHRLHRPIG